MRDLHRSQILTRAENVKNKTSESTLEDSSTAHDQDENMKIIDKNPKLDHRLLSETYRLIMEYERLVGDSKGVLRVKQGADYNLSHPFGSNKVPTDPREIGKRLSDVKSR